MRKTLELPLTNSDMLYLRNVYKKAKPTTNWIVLLTGQVSLPVLFFIQLELIWDGPSPYPPPVNTLVVLLI